MFNQPTPIGFAGKVELVLYDAKTQSAVTAWVHHNTPTLTLRSGLAAWMTGSAFAPPTHIALGTGTASATNISASSLHMEIARSAITTNQLWNTYSALFITTFGTNQGNGTIREVGLLNSATGGALWAIASAPSIVKTTANTLQATWYLAVTSGSAL